uniref:Aldehyde dehydrogenase domain-containing protein n=1 Tax=Bionectria ochroleuca TaxID=29856 RepID=A0A8H7NBS5_BIOOC
MATTSSDYKVSFEGPFQNVINNQLTSTATTRHAICPSTEKPLWEVPVSTAEDLDRAVAAGRAAFPAWSKLSYDDRQKYLDRFADAIEENQEGFIKLLGQEVGKPPQAGGLSYISLWDWREGSPSCASRRRRSLMMRIARQLSDTCHWACAQVLFPGTSLSRLEWEN